MTLDNRTCFLVNLRDGLRCRVCGRGPTAQATYHRGFGYHHVIPRSAGGVDDVTNVILLCDACHDAHHAGSQLFPPETQPAPSSFTCAECDAAVDAANVQMNCGWYQCPRCGRRIHLFDHFKLTE